MEGAIGLVEDLVINRERGFDRLISNEVIDALEKLNVNIADAALVFFNELLYSGNIYTGEDAYCWGLNFITYEQGVIAVGYANI